MPARAAEDPPPSHGDYFGAFVALELRGGPAWRASDDDGAYPDLGVGVRVATLVSLVDLELGVDTAGLTRRDHTLRRTSIVGLLRLHPLFIRLLQGDTLSLLMASIHLAFGPALEVLSVDGPRQDDTHAAFGFHVGAGAELPLTDTAARPWSIWLGLAWRMTITGFGDAPPGLRDMDQHALFLSLSLRLHGVDFMRFPRPPELRDDE